MAKRLELLAEDAELRHTPYSNDLRVELIERMTAATADTPPLEFQVQYAVELLRAGRSEDAVREVDRITGLLERDPRYSTPRNKRQLRRLKAISHLRIGEQENCILDHTIDSCLLPIRGRGIHRLQRGSRAAVEVYHDLLEEDPGDLSSRWLMNIGYMTLGEYPEGVPPRWLVPPSVFVPEYEIERFPDVAPGAEVAQLSTSGGSAVEDFNGDGYLDVATSSWSPTDPLRYFENRTDGRFADRTGAAGLTGLTGGINLEHADYDNDGRPDLLVLRGAWLGELGVYPNSLLRNLGGSFEDVTERAGILSFAPSHSAAWGDYD
ncbi:MAG: VCBS repeat-containing protein, partial [Gemmatimonadetes bacterium]|nr:VCBS repeat-containing protein [Gemmatimonadota bacterium]